MAGGTTDQKNPPWFVLRLGHAALPSWADYFQRMLGSMPAGMRMLENHKINEFLVPCEQPEWFDVGYAPPRYIPHWPTNRMEEERTPERKERVRRMMAEIAGASLKTLDSVSRDERRKERNFREMEAQAARVKAMNVAAGIEVPEGSIPVSPMLRAKLTGQPVNA